MKKTCVCVIILLISLFLIAGCSERTPVTEYSVKFVTNGGTKIAEIFGTVVTDCPVPELDGYVFEGWYEDSDFKTGQVTFPYTPQGQTTLYAKYINVAVGNEEIRYYYDAEGEFYIAKRYNGNSINVVVPATYAGKPVSKIASGFLGVTSRVERLYLGENVEKIETLFYLCPKFNEFILLKNSDFLSVEDGVLYDKNKTVLYCFPRNKTVSNDGVFTLPDTVKIVAENAFRSVDGLKILNLGENTESVDEDFSENKNLEKINASSRFYYSDNGVLYNAEKTVLLSFPVKNSLNYTLLSTTEEVRENAFRNAKAVTLAFNSSLRVFNPQDNTNLTEIVVPSSNDYYASVDGVLYDKGMTEIIKYPENKQGEKFTLSGVKSIGKNAFAFCKNLKILTINKEVENIKQFAFFNAKTNEIVFEKDSELKAIDNTAFIMADDMQNLVLTATVPPEFDGEGLEIEFNITVPAESYSAYVDAWSYLYLRIVKGE